MVNLRKYRIFNLAIFDYVVTFIAVLILHYYMWVNAKVNYKRTVTQYFISLIVVFIGMLGLGTIIHYFFNVKSTFSHYIGLA
jgi:hypothetical protein